MNVLSLFDGMSGGQLAIQRAGIKVNNYYASEVEEYPIKVTQHNFPNTIQVGSVIDLKKKQLKEMNIDLLIGGSPCQGFSVAGKMKGMTTSCNMEITTLKQYKKLKREGFKFDGQSYLFWEYMRILKIIKPKYFLLENVRIQKKWKDIFDKVVGVEPIMINSSLVSAQNRVRYYWTNIPNVTQPEDKNILFSDLLNDGETPCIVKDIGKTITNKGVKKSACLLARDYKGFGNQGMSAVITINGDVRRVTPTEYEKLQTLPINYTVGVSNTQRYKMLGNGFTIDVISHILKGIKS